MMFGNDTIVRPASNEYWEEKLKKDREKLKKDKEDKINKKLETINKILELLNGYKFTDIEEILDCVSNEAEKHLTLNFKREVK